ncbi:cyclase family protein [Plantactinospora sp. KLBMP9567]|uniref:cyclase family protein n=1 Tax=Plantactinospora sp. KLBMP9567 TaxID=3085900 RepID=UPI002980E941|nr:cyclase family protein [Plantactinospora sp. KLBMP9567]MDW5328887.1 cyclase family protein [Plantactinospora sp. KLBMP9567]
MIIDLSHPIHEGMRTYPGLPGPKITTHLSRAESRSRYTDGVEFHIGRINMVANTGTYLDAPFHRYPDGADTAGIPLEQVVDVAGVVCTAEPEGEIGPEILDGTEVAGKAVLFRTGWDGRWGTDDYFGESHPYLGRELVDRLTTLAPAVVGIDSVNIDAMSDKARPAHSLLLAAGIPLVEHLRGLDRLPARGFRFFAPPLAVHAFGTCSVRAFAIVD